MWLDVKRPYCCHLEVDEFPIAARSGVVISPFKKCYRLSHTFFIPLLGSRVLVLFTVSDSRLLWCCRSELKSLCFFFIFFY